MPYTNRRLRTKEKSGSTQEDTRMTEENKPRLEFPGRWARRSDWTLLCDLVPTPFVGLWMPWGERADRPASYGTLGSDHTLGRCAFRARGIAVERAGEYPSYSAPAAAAGDRSSATSLPCHRRPSRRRAPAAHLTLFLFSNGFLVAGHFSGQNKDVWPWTPCSSRSSCALTRDTILLGPLARRRDSLFGLVTMGSSSFRGNN